MQSLQHYDCWDAKFYTLWLLGCKVYKIIIVGMQSFYKIMIVGMQSFTKLWLLGCKFTLEKLDLGVIVSMRLHSGIFLTTQTSFFSFSDQRA